MGRRPAGARSPEPGELLAGSPLVASFSQPPSTRGRPPPERGPPPGPLQVVDEFVLSSLDPPGPPPARPGSSPERTSRVQGLFTTVNGMGGLLAPLPELPRGASRAPAGRCHHRDASRAPPGVSSRPLSGLLFVAPDAPPLPPRRSAPGTGLRASPSHLLEDAPRTRLLPSRGGPRGGPRPNPQQALLRHLTETDFAPPDLSLVCSFRQKPSPRRTPDISCRKTRALAPRTRLPERGARGGPRGPGGRYPWSAPAPWSFFPPHRAARGSYGELPSPRSPCRPRVGVRERACGRPEAPAIHAPPDGRWLHAPPERRRRVGEPLRARYTGMQEERIPSPLFPLTGRGVPWSS